MSGTKAAEPKKEMSPLERNEYLMTIPAEAVEKRMVMLKAASDKLFFEQGILLRRVRDENLWQDWGGKKYATFKDWCFSAIGLKLRTAYYFIAINEGMLALKLSDDWMRKAIALGWSKLQLILQVASTQKAFMHWYAKAINQNEKTLEADVRSYKAKLPTAAELLASKSDVAADGETEAHTQIQMGLTFEEAEDWEHFNKAVELCEQVVGKGLPNGKAASLMAVHYMSHMNTHMQGGPVMDVNDLLVSISEAYGVDVAVKNPTENKWVPIVRTKATATQAAQEAQGVSAAEKPKVLPAASKGVAVPVKKPAAQVAPAKVPAKASVKPPVKAPVKAPAKAPAKK